ncbi:hypothetical protein ACT29H_09630 [Thermophagus sp. OGC60D27]|uniref:hypothetical protein n=1 Tax=Thermophagus sp. OGC60D27 TaxID=3458415 RepID=UPI00403810E2
MSSRKEFLETFEGQKYEYWKRFSRNSIFITYQVEQFQTKRSKSKIENLRFQNYILEKIIHDKKRCFRGNVAAEFIFKVNQRNAPAVQSLLKHYIDLIQKPLNDVKTKRDFLLLKDDSQIKALSSHYWKVNNNEKQEITIIIIPFRDFVFNLQLASDLQFGRFKELKNKSDFDRNGYNNENSNFSEYKEVEHLRGVNIEVDGEKIDYNEFNRQIYIEQNNQIFLKSNSDLFANSVLYLITEPEDNKIEFSKLRFSPNKIGRVSALEGWYNMDLGSVPVSEGESKSFKEEIKTAIKEWKSKNGRLLPKNSSIALKFFYEKPSKVTHDLDNLLRYVLPHFKELISLDRYFKDVPSIEIYQIQTISKNKDSGNLYLRIEEFGKNNLFRITQRLIDKYNE